MLPSSASTTSNLAVTGVSGTVENRPARQVKLRTRENLWVPETGHTARDLLARHEREPGMIRRWRAPAAPG